MGFRNYILFIGILLHCSSFLYLLCYSGDFSQQVLNLPLFTCSFIQFYINQKSLFQHSRAKKGVLQLWLIIIIMNNLINQFHTSYIVKILKISTKKIISSSYTYTHYRSKRYITKYSLLSGSSQDQLIKALLFYDCSVSKKLFFLIFQHFQNISPHI